MAGFLSLVLPGWMAEDDSTASRIQLLWGTRVSGGTIAALLVITGQTRSHVAGAGLLRRQM